MDLKENNYIACISKLHARLEDKEADIRSLLAFNFCSFGNVSLKIKLCIIYILIIDSFRVVVELYFSSLFYVFLIKNLLKPF
jgi:hypothetical protein